MIQTRPIIMHPNVCRRLTAAVFTGMFVYYFATVFVKVVQHGKTKLSHSKLSVRGLRPGNITTIDKLIVPESVPLKLKASATPLRETLHQASKQSSIAKEFSVQNIDRLVHIDLKGAPPKLKYLKELFPKLKEWGATGILLEYEDMFPYTGELSVLARHNAYNQSDIEEISKTAKENNLKIMPLVQTFGHLEFVLKHKEFSHIREVSTKVKNLNPALNASLDVVLKMVDQTLAAHPDASHIHIGCDEVYYLGHSPASVQLMKKKRINKNELFLYHTKRVLTAIKHKYPQMQAVMWDDMLRKMSIIEIKRWQLGNLVEPMVWRYTPTVKKSFPDAFWRKQALLFRGVWMASCFKGATGSQQYVVNVNYHMQNHVQWLEVMRTTHQVHHPGMVVRGIALTGWTRYDHLMPLCEILPVAIPSLAMCLQFISQSGYNHTADKVSKLLHCETRINLKPMENRNLNARCSFPGSAIYDSVLDLLAARSLMSRFVKSKTKDDAAKNALQKNMLTVGHDLPEVLLSVFERDAVHEFVKLQLLDAAAAIPELKQRLQQALYSDYPWMKPAAQL